MIYIILSGLLSVFLVVFSYFVDKKTAINSELTVNNILLLFTYTLCEFLSLIFIFYLPNYNITFMLVRLALILENLFILNFCLSVLVFPSPSKSKFLLVGEIILIVLLAFRVFGDSISYVASEKMGLTLYTQYIFPEFTIRWKDVWDIFYRYVIPGITALYIIVRPANTKNRLAQEHLIINLFALGTIVVTSVALTYASSLVPFFYSLKPHGYLIAILLAYSTTRIHVLYDMKTLLFKSLRIIWLHVVPAILLGLVTSYAIINYRDENIFLFIGILLLVMTAIFFRTIFLPRIFSKRTKTLNDEYDKSLEKEFAELEYNLSAENFAIQVDKILSEAIMCKGINILLSNGKEYSCVYSSFSSISSIPLDFPAFSVLVGVGRQVVFRNQLDSQYVLAGARFGLNELFEESKADACILLAEGYRVFGVILLSEKMLGNDYTHYDYATFTKLYPYFFMIGYYMNSMANEGVIGTINREIKMSDQIIHSIQENMDFIRSPKVDVGYLMNPARNIGGEFIDFIRLTDTRHIVILGSLSGKGITASMSMVILKSIIRIFLSKIHDFKELIQHVNHFIRFNLPRGTYFAGVFALLDLSENTMYYINCGVPTLMLYTQSYNNVIEIQGDGRVLGFVSDISKYAKVKKIKLNPGDLVFACTDGLIESQSLRGEAFGKGRIQGCILDNLNYSSNKITQFTYENMREFTAKEQEADITCLVMKFFADKGESHGTA